MSDMNDAPMRDNEPAPAAGPANASLFASYAPGPDGVTPWWQGLTPPAVFHYSQTTAEYLGTSSADPSPLEPDVWHYPAHSTSEAPPTFGELEAAVWQGEVWAVLEDRRGETWYAADGTPVEITTVGQDRSGLTSEPPPPPYVPISIPADTLFVDRMTDDEYDEVDASIRAGETARVYRGWSAATVFDEGTALWTLLVKHLDAIGTTETRKGELLARP